MTGWIFIEVGGSSTQSTVERDGGYQFFDGVLRREKARYALAVPGVIRPPEVLYASNLGWPEVADPARELGLADVAILVNDAVAAGLGESVLRSVDARSRSDLLYVALGTGVGTAVVRNGVATDAEMGHIPVGGAKFCEGCRAYGCLNSEIEAKRLSHPVTDAEVSTTVSMIVRALEGLWGRGPVPSLLVLAGGIVASVPSMVDRLAGATDLRVETSRAAPGAKSAAYMGLHHLARDRSEGVGR